MECQLFHIIVQIPVVLFVREPVLQEKVKYTHVIVLLLNISGELRFAFLFNPFIIHQLVF